MPIRRLEDTFTGTSATIGADELTSTALASVEHVKPHIQPGVLQPAVAGKDLSGTALGGSYVYGTAHTDGHSYYYTDIKGSKPIKDPRIGSHFGSQRHKFKSLQLLEQETATHGANVYSEDGREWVRCIGDYVVHYNTNGTGLLYSGATSTPSIEITGYFSSLNLLAITLTSNSGCVLTIDGVAGSEINPFLASNSSPLGGRYVDRASVVNIVTGQTLGIHTVKITDHANADENYHFGCELIAQDTTSTATKSQIQIPSQNVVSYGKKFTVAETKHYNPFAFKTDGSTVWASGAHNGTAWPIGTGSSTNIDTATSLGLAAWLHSSNYYKPYNGGRVVKWIASDGTIKTSVNMMPPNARSYANSASLTNATAKANASIANNTFYPTMEAGTVDPSQAEVAKTFHYREFGNGGANGHASYKDASVGTTAQLDVAYVMDDGLTSLSVNDGYYPAIEALSASTSDMFGYLTFIGTGLSFHHTSGVWNHIVQNLPYGTHIAKFNWTNGGKKVIVDGVEVMNNNNQAIENYEFSFHQPKMPPIPEDAVIISDYMLMADFVKQTDAEPTQISKGVRAVSGSRDVFCDDTGSRAFYSDATDSVFLGTSFYMGMATFYSHAGTDTSFAQLPFFGTNALVHLQGSNIAHVIDFGGSTNVAKTALDSSVGSAQDIISIDSSATLGINTVKTTLYRGGYSFQGYDVASPIHTSSHYQTFETPFLHELVGGDRNMEQTNLVVTPDGKTWDEVTRDVSYIGRTSLIANTDNSASEGTTVVLFDEFRGSALGNGGTQNYYNMQKDWAIAYDRFICLRDGDYAVLAATINYASSNQGDHAAIKINGNLMARGHGGGSGHGSISNYVPYHFKRGDYVQIFGKWYAGGIYSRFNITRL